MQYLPLAEMKIDAILLLIGINDFSKRLSLGDSYDPNFLEKAESMNTLLVETFGEGSYQYPNDRLFKKIAIWRMARRFKARVLEKSSQRNAQDESGEIYKVWRKHRQQAGEIRNELPDLTAALEEYSRNIHKMIDIAREKSIRLVLMTQPTMWRSDLPKELDALLWLGGIGDFQNETGKAYYSSEALEKGMHRYNNMLLEICRAKRMECIDLASFLEKDTSVFYDDVHFNESGARKVSRVVSDCFLAWARLRQSYPRGGHASNGEEIAGEGKVHVPEVCDRKTLKELEHWTG
jgi:lysophospholipase L1-like esterase